MTDRPNDPLSEDDARVRALLADARTDEPMPADVAARMDDVLAGLAAGRSSAGAQHTPSATEPATERTTRGGTGRGTVVPLRRRVLGGLVAAAAVVAIGGGIAIAQRGQAGHSGSAAATSDSGAATSSAPAGGRVILPSPSGSLLRAPASTKQPDRHTPMLAGTLPALTTAAFGEQVRSLLGLDNGLSTFSAATPAPTGDSRAREPRHSGRAGNLDDRAAQAVRTCTAPSPAVGPREDVRPILLDGVRATLVVDPVRARPRLARAYSCDDGAVLARTTLAR
ncbi:hypothetical protein [Nocardioides terrisoli]|uniref:hypothetical protein n=1 Tax=Nocardioides terrisoli TaxID=3388267 RepID=UPI00287BAAE3|nr:hypothetical protein [Nocardioides marmorisolisilvae]